MLKLLQIMGQTQKTLSQTLVSEGQNQSLSKIQALFDSLKAKKDEPEPKNVYLIKNLSIKITLLK